MPSKDSKNFTMRGETMTRIETFVAAAFAFAVTMLVISVGTVPSSMTEFVEATKQIPAFTASCAVILWIWHSHALWCRRYGLEDGMTIFLSGCLIILVLTYIYPLRLMMQALFYTISQQYLPLEISFNHLWEVRFMFAFYSVGFILFSLNFIAFYGYAMGKKVQLQLKEIEYYDSQTETHMWTICAVVGLVSLFFSLTLSSKFLGMSGYVFFMLFPLLTGYGFYRRKNRQKVFYKE